MENQKKNVTSFLAERSFLDENGQQRTYVACFVELDGQLFEVAPSPNNKRKYVFTYLKYKNYKEA